MKPLGVMLPGAAMGELRKINQWNLGALHLEREIQKDKRSFENFSIRFCQGISRHLDIRVRFNCLENWFNFWEYI